MQVGVPPKDQRQGPPGDPGETGPIDITHRENMYASIAGEVSFPLVEATHTDQRDPIGPNRRSGVANRRQLDRVGPQQGGQRHAMDVAADRGCDGVFMSPWASTQRSPSARRR